MRDNLLMDAAAGAEMVYRERYHEYDATIAELMQRYSKREGRAPYLIVPGGSSPTGALGFVNAMFELKQQIERNEAPEPAAIYVPLGTMGTAAGMYLGVRAARLRSRLVGVRVTPLNLADWEQFAVLCRQTCDLLHSLDPSFPDPGDPAEGFSICHDFFEPGYGLAGAPVNEAVSLIERTDRITLDGTYTGKAFAAFLAAARKREDGPLLFWNTKNSHHFAEEMLAEGEKKLPEEFRRFLKGFQDVNNI